MNFGEKLINAFASLLEEALSLFLEPLHTFQSLRNTRNMVLLILEVSLFHRKLNQFFKASLTSVAVHGVSF